MQSTERSTRSSKRFVPEPAPNHEPQTADHTDSGQFMCIECGETFDNKLELNSHRQSHVTKRQFTCSHCGRGFHHQFFLQMHERSHEGGIPHTSLAKSSAGRPMSTRSSKPSQDVDIIHVAPAPSKSTYHLNSRVEFRRERSASQDVAPRECVTRRTQGTSPTHHRADDSETSQFELRISKLSDRTIHLIDPYGNTLEILAEVFNTYTIGEPDDDDDEEEEEEEEESMSPAGDSRVSASPPSSPAPLSMETTQDLGVCSSPRAEVSSELLPPGVLDKDVLLRQTESVSSPSISPKTLPDLGDDSEPVPTTQTTAQSDTPDLPGNDLTMDIPTISSISGENQVTTEGPPEGDVTVCGEEPTVVSAQTEDPSLNPDDLNAVKSLDGDVSQGGHISTEHRPVTPEPLRDDLERLSSTASPTMETDAIDPSLPVPPLISETDLLLDMNEDNDDLVTSCMNDFQDLQNDQEIPQKIAAWEEPELGERSCSEDKSQAETLLEVDSTKLPTLTLHEGVPESDKPTTLTLHEGVPESDKPTTLTLHDGVPESDKPTTLTLHEGVPESDKPTTLTLHEGVPESDKPTTLSLHEGVPESDKPTTLTLHDGVPESDKPTTLTLHDGVPESDNPTTLTLHDGVPESDKPTSLTLHDGVPESDKPDKDGEDSSSPVESDHKDRTETAFSSELEPSLSKEDLNQAVPGDAPQPNDVCAVEPSPQNTISEDIAEQKMLLDYEERSVEKDSEGGQISLEIKVGQPVVEPDTFPPIASGSNPIPQEVTPEESGEPIDADKAEDSSIENDDSSELNPDCDPGVSSTLEDLQTLSSSNLELDTSSRDKPAASDVSFSNIGLISSSEIEESQVEDAPAELTALMDSSQEKPQMSRVTEGGDDEKILSSEVDNLIGLPEAVGVVDSLLSPCDEDLAFTEDVLFGASSLVGITAACVVAPECDLSQGAQPSEQDVSTSGEMLSGSRSLENTDLKDDVLFENLGGDVPGPALCLLDETLDLSPNLKVLPEKCLLSSDDVKDLVENDIDKSLSPEVPPKQYIQMSNADLTENDLADDLESGTVLLDAPSVDETPKEDDISAVSGDDESTVPELSDILSPEIQDNEYAEGLDDKHVGVGSQCVKCGRRVRRGRKELVWFPDCYKCRLKSKREERRSGEGTCSDFVLETDRKKASSDFSRFHIKQEVESVHDHELYRTGKSVQSLHSSNRESPALHRKTYKCPKCEKSFRLPTLLARHMKCHTLPQCLGCGCPMTLKNKAKRIPKRCHKCFQKFKEQRKEEMALGVDAEDESLDSDSGSLYMDEADDDEPESYTGDAKPGSIKRGTKPFHSVLMRKHKKMNPAIQALYCTCDSVSKAGKQPKICKNCQKPFRDRIVSPPKVRGKVTQLKTKKRPPSDNQDLLEESSLSCDTELSPDEDFGKEENEPFTDLETGEQTDPADGDKPRSCLQCGKIFKCNKSMRLHMFSHTAMQCESCGCRLQLKKRVGRWSKKCRVCRLLTKDTSSVDEVLPSEKNMASLRHKMKQSKIVRNRKVHSIVKNKKDLKWMNMILAVKGLTRKPRKKKEQSVKSPKEEKSGDSSDPSTCSGAEEETSVLKALGRPKGLSMSKKKILGGMSKANKKCMYRERNIIKIEEQPLPPYVGDPSTPPLLVKEEEENQCLECKEMFLNFDLLLSHQQEHVKDQAFACTQCPQSFSTEQYLSIHISSHAEGPPFRCPECNKTFTRRNHLGVHRRVHTGVRPYVCPDCPCRFRQKGSLIIHRYTHRNLQFMLLKPFQCSVCDKSFKQKERLVIHERLHTGECPFSCKDCDKVFPSKSRLYVHRRSHKVTDSSSSVEQNTSCKEESGEHPFQCKVCDKICSTKASLVLHSKVHKPPAISDQSASHKVDPEKTTDEIPMASENPLNIKTEPEAHPFTCKDCNKVCSTKASLVLHRKVHGVDRKSDVGRPVFICKDCHKVCLSKASLVLHRKVHKSPLMGDLKADIGDPPYTCQVCSKVCSTKASFVLHSKVHKTSSSSVHIRKTGIGSKFLVCKKCNLGFSTKASFVLHRKMHRASQSIVKKLEGTGEHPFTCKECNKVCSTKASLVLHSKVHKASPVTSDQSPITQTEVEVKPYHCKECGKLYSTKGRLLSHMKLHASQDGASSGGEQLKIDSEEKPFACPICNMRFTRMKILVRHKLLHGEDVFTCGHCGKRFLFQKSLMNHVQICLKKSKGKSLLGKEKAPKKRKMKDASGDESAPKKRKNENKKAASAVQKLKQKRLMKAKKMVINKEKGKAKKPKKPKGEEEPEAEKGEQGDGKPERSLENVSKEKEISKDKKPKDVGKVKKVVKKVPLKPKRQKVASESLKKWRIIAAATVKKRKLQAAMSVGKKVTVKKKGPGKAKPGGKSSKE